MILDCHDGIIANGIKLGTILTENTFIAIVKTQQKKNFIFIVIIEMQTEYILK